MPAEGLTMESCTEMLPGKALYWINTASIYKHAIKNGRFNVYNFDFSLEKVGFDNASTAWLSFKFFFSFRRQMKSEPESVCRPSPPWSPR